MLSIKIPKHGIFGDIILKEMGKINILTGKNNSGKSQLLGAISGGDKLIFGVSADNKLKDSLRDHLRSLRGWSNTGEWLINETETIASTAIFSGYGDVVFFDEMDSFVQRIEKLLAYQSGLGNIHNSLRNWFDATIRARRTRLYIPTKRHVSHEMPVSPVTDVAREGGNLINKLFHLKNQLPDSPEQKLYDRIQCLFEYITDGSNFQIATSTHAQVGLYFRNSKNNFVSSESSGFGLREALFLLYQIISSDAEVICLDEIETHLHPDMQRRLMHVIGENYMGTMLISTHSNVAISSAAVSKYYKTDIIEGEIRAIDTSSLASLLTDIGYSVADNLVSDVVLLVEGKHDIGVYREIMRTFGIIPKSNVKIWQLGGNDMDGHDLTIVKQLNKVYAIIDRDTESATSREAFMKNCKDAGIPCHQLSKYSIENYIPIDVIRNVCGPNAVPSELKSIDPATSVKSQGIQLSKRKMPEMARSLSRTYLDSTDIAHAMKEIQTLISLK